MSPSRRATIFLVITAAGFGGTWVAAPWATDAIAPLTVAFVRFTLAALLLFAWTRVRGLSLALPRREVPLVLGVAVTSVIAYNILFLYGVTLAPASHGAILVPGLIPLATLVLSRLIHGTRIAARQVGGIALSLVGLALVVGPELTASGSTLVGDAMFMVSASVWASYTLIGRASRLDSAVLTFYGAAVGAVGLLPLSLIVGGPGLGLADLPEAPARALLGVLYLGSIGTVLSFVTFLEGVRLIGPARATAFSVLIPIFGLALTVSLLGEALAPIAVVGAAIALVGLWITQTTPSAPAAEGTTPEPA